MRREALDLALQRQIGPRKGRGVVALQRDHRLEPGHAFVARRRDGDGEFGRLALDRVQPMGIARALLQQAIAAAQGALELAGPGAVTRIDRQHQPVEKAPSLARRFEEQAIHRRREPDNAQMVGEGARRGDGRAVDAADPNGRLDARLPLQPGSKLTGGGLILDEDRGRKAAGAADARALAKRSPAQPASWRKKRQRFEEIGLARAVLPDQRDDRPFRRQIERLIGAEVVKHHPPHEGAAKRRKTDRALHSNT